MVLERHPNFDIDAPDSFMYITPNCWVKYKNSLPLSNTIVQFIKLRGFVN